VIQVVECLPEPPVGRAVGHQPYRDKPPGQLIYEPASDLRTRVEPGHHRLALHNREQADQSLGVALQYGAGADRSGVHA
jgi:hypothetical protein